MKASFLDRTPPAFIPFSLGTKPVDPVLCQPVRAGMRAEVALAIIDVRRPWVIGWTVVGAVALGVSTLTTPSEASAATCGAVRLWAPSGLPVVAWMSGPMAWTRARGMRALARVPEMSQSRTDTAGNAWSWPPRLYAIKGWGAVRADGSSSAGVYRYGAKYIPEGSPDLILHLTKWLHPGRRRPHHRDEQYVGPRLHCRSSCGVDRLRGRTKC